MFRVSLPTTTFSSDYILAYEVVFPFFESFFNVRVVEDVSIGPPIHPVNLDVFG
jgi:hypothetical protein